MLDIRLIREQPDFVKARLATRGGDDRSKIDEVLRVGCGTAQSGDSVPATERRSQTVEQGDRRETQPRRIVGGAGESRPAKSEIEIALLNRANSRRGGTAAESLLLEIPNLPHADAPIGNDRGRQSGRAELGREAAIDWPVSDHVALGTRLKLFDLERAAKLSGSGFICFTGAGAKLERALINFMLDLHTREHGYLEMSPPFLVRRDCMIGTTQLPKFEEDMYGLEENQLFLAPTAEVPVTNFHREEILPAAELPKKFVAYTPCFRREAGSAGRETRGIIRVHQFDKVELVKITTPETSYAEHESLTANAERVLQLLDLHYRVIELCTGDLGFGSAKTYDIEVWSPGQNGYLEVSSCSNFEDFQARRMNLRFKDAEGKNRFCHTLNGSGIGACPGFSRR